MVGWLSKDEVESIWKEVAVIKVLSQDFPEGFDKNKSLGQDSLCPNQGSKRTPSNKSLEYYCNTTLLSMWTKWFLVEFNIMSPRFYMFL
jgi:hypothetical protein